MGAWRHCGLLASAVLACAACVPAVVVRASSVSTLSVDDSTVLLKRPVDGAVKALTAALDKRGFHLTGEYPAKDGSFDKVFRFKGNREAVTRGFVTTDETGDVEGETRSFQFGSVFFASVHVTSAGETKLLLVGKPTIDGEELCSDADTLFKKFQYWCVDTKVRNGQSIMRYISGNEEAEVVRGVLLELRGI